MADTVEEAHPYVERVSEQGAVYLEERTPADYEDIEALPVVEQAAIVCACRASDRSCPEAVGEEMLPDGPIAVLAWGCLPRCSRSTRRVSAPRADDLGRGRGTHPHQEGPPVTSYILAILAGIILGAGIPYAILADSPRGFMRRLIVVGGLLLVAIGALVAGEVMS